MKLYIKQKVFSLTSKFTVKDESGNDRYFVDGEFFSLRGRLRIICLLYTSPSPRD